MSSSSSSSSAASGIPINVGGSATPTKRTPDELKKSILITDDNMETILAVEEYKAMVARMTPEDAKSFEEVIRDIVELNGTGDIAGVAASYIKETEYFQDFTDVKVGEGLRKALSFAYNWQSCGRGSGGLFASAVRYALRSHFARNRETTVHTVVPEHAEDVIKEFRTALAGKEGLFNFFLTNALSVAALAGALMNKTGHHWNSEHRAPQIAFVNSMGMKDTFVDSDYRKVFYVAIHPLPLRYIEELRASVAEGKVNEVAEVVRLRCGGPPSGFGAINVCATAVNSLLIEPYMTETAYVDEDTLVIDRDADQNAINVILRRNKDIERRNNQNAAIRAALPYIRNELRVIYTTNTMLCKNAARYHIFANHYGYAERAYLDMTPLTRAMCLLAAYIMSKVGGTLAKSPALVKYVAQHARAVAKATAAFGSQFEGETMYDILGTASFASNADMAHAPQAADHENANHQQSGFV